MHACLCHATITYIQSQRKQFESGQAITKGGGSGGPLLENFEKNAACWRILVIFYGQIMNNYDSEYMTFIIK